MFARKKLTIFLLLLVVQENGGNAENLIGKPYEIVVEQEKSVVNGENERDSGSVNVCDS